MEQQQSTSNIIVTWRGKKFVLEMNSGATLRELGHELQKLTDVKEDTMRLIVPQFSTKSSKLLSPFSEEHSHLTLQETSIFEGKSVKMMGVPKLEVDEVLQNAKENLRIAGFEDEGKRLRQRMLDRPNGMVKLPQGPYIFCDFRTLHIAGVELNPPPSEALKRMHMLAADPGIVAIMNKHRWRVGIMTEMAPEGYVGVSPKCILGFNKNHGEEISLRLRTDDLKGFRKHESIKTTLLHELAHMVYSEHDANFYALDKQLNHEASTLDWTKSRSHTLSKVSHSMSYEDEIFPDTHNKTCHKIGGNASDQLANPRATSVAAAYRRLAMAPTDKLDGEPNSDESGLATVHQISDTDMDRVEHDKEPNPDNFYGSHSTFEPGYDDVESGEAMGFEPDFKSNEGIIMSEPDPDDSQLMQLLRPLISGKELARVKTYNEPDPDDSQASLKCAIEIQPNYSEVMKTVSSGIQLGRTFDEPDHDDSMIEEEPMGNKNLQNSSENKSDPDDSLGTGAVQSQPDLDPDDNLGIQLGTSVTPIDEPDPDDQELQRIQDPVNIVSSRLQKAIKMLQSEADPSEVVTALQTLFKIIRNVIEHPTEMKFKRIRKANPIIQKNVANYKGAMEILSLIGFSEDTMFDEIGIAETYLVLTRNDLGLLWLAKLSLETCIAY